LKKVIVIGGGIIGLCSAYYLKKEGHEVTLIDKSSMDYGASYVNAGFISPSHIIPLAAPGVMKNGVKWMFNSASPLYIKPKLKASFLQWVWAFNRSCSANNVQRSKKAIRDITLMSRDLFSEIKKNEDFNFHYTKKGLLMLCQTEAMLNKELNTMKVALEEGLPVKELSKKEIQKLEPNTTINAIGATFYECDAHSTPHEFMNEMKKWLVKNGVTLLKNETVKDILVSENKMTGLITSERTLKADAFILAAGSWSSKLSEKLGIKILLQAGKGYRINSERDFGIQLPAILCESNVALTPMNGFTRFAGTMEIAGINHTINPVRVKAIADSVTKFYPDITISKTEKAAAACGLRPVSPDGMAYIGTPSACSNLVIATGHAMMGWSMGPATGKLVSEIISEKKPSLNLDVFHPDRKF